MKTLKIGSGGRRLAAREPFKQPFEPRHALAQVGDIAAKLAQARDNQPGEHGASADDGDNDHDRVERHCGFYR